MLKFALTMTNFLRSRMGSGRCYASTPVEDRNFRTKTNDKLLVSFSSDIAVGGAWRDLHSELKLTNNLNLNLNQLSFLCGLPGGHFPRSHPILSRDRPHSICLCRCLRKIVSYHPPHARPDLDVLHPNQHSIRESKPNSTLSRLLLCVPCCDGVDCSLHPPTVRKTQPENSSTCSLESNSETFVDIHLRQADLAVM